MIEKLKTLIKETETTLKVEVDNYNQMITQLQELQQNIQQKRVYLEVLQDRYKTYNDLLTENEAEIKSNIIQEYNGEVIAQSKHLEEVNT